MGGPNNMKGKNSRAGCCFVLLFILGKKSNQSPQLVWPSWCQPLPRSPVSPCGQSDHTCQSQLEKTIHPIAELVWHIKYTSTLEDEQVRFSR